MLGGLGNLGQFAQIFNIGKGILGAIPYTAQDVVVQKEASADAIYDELYSALLSRGYNIVNADKAPYFC